MRTSRSHPELRERLRPARAATWLAISGTLEPASSVVSSEESGKVPSTVPNSEVNLVGRPAAPPRARARSG
jgi:hypothetical protein